MKQKTLLKTGIIGSLVAVLCCATPVLVVILSAVGLAALTGYLDYVLMPALVVFLAITAYAFFWKSNCRGGKNNECKL